VLKDPETTSEEIARRTKSSFIWFTVLPLFLHFIRFVSSIILARLLLPSDFGIIGIAGILIYYTNTLTDFGFSKAIIQHRNITADHYNTYFTVNLAISILLFLFFNISSDSFASFFNEPRLVEVINVISLLFLTTALHAVPLTNLKKNIHFKLIAIAEAFNVFSSMFISLFLAMNGFGYWSLVIAMIVSNLIYYFFLRIASKDLKPSLSFSRSCFHDLFSFGIWDFLWGQTRIISDNVDKILIGRILNMDMLGYYEKAQGFAKMPSEQFADRLSAVSFSTFSKLQSNKDELLIKFIKIMTVNTYICFPIFIGMTIIAEDFTLLFLGEKWRNMIEPLQILSISFLVTSVSGPIISMNIALGNIKRQTLMRAFLLVFLIPVLFVSIPYGIIYTSFVVLLFSFFILIISFILLSKESFITNKLLLQILLPPIISSILLFIGTSTISKIIIIEDRLYSLFISVSTGIIIYAACTILLPFEHWDFIRAGLCNILKKYFNNQYNKTS
jgi:O-antigen/teichoic acid export membrane protein